MENNKRSKRSQKEHDLYFSHPILKRNKEMLERLNDRDNVQRKAGFRIILEWFCKFKNK